MVAIIVVGLNVMSYISNLQNNFSQVEAQKNIKATEKISENLNLRNMSINNNKFNFTLYNSGSLPAHLVGMWITNNTARKSSIDWHTYYPLDTYVNPRATTANIGQSLSLMAKNTASYSVSFVTERGNQMSFNVLSPSDQGIQMSLTPIPRTVFSPFRVTLHFTVTNNSTSGNIIQNVSPMLGNPGITIVNATASATLVSSPSAQAVLLPAQTAFFNWVYQVQGNAGDVITFNVTIANAKQGNWVTNDVKFANPKLAEQSGVAIQASGISISKDYNSGTLHFHVESTDVPNNLLSQGHQTHPAFPDQTATTSTSLATVADQVWFLTKNSTSSLSVSAGQWNLTIFYKSGVGSGSHQIGVKYEDWDSTNSIFRSTIYSSTLTLASVNQITRYSTLSPSLSALTINGGGSSTQDRVRITLTYVSGPTFILYYDQTSNDSFLLPPSTSPTWPLYQTYSSGNVKVNVKNTGPLPIYVDDNSRIVFTQASGSLSFGGIVTNWQNVTGSSLSGTVSPTADSRILIPGDLVQLIFSPPCRTPIVTSACASSDSVSTYKGNYNVAVRVSGYDINGGFVLRVVVIGIVVV